jgi:hypothetical protein
VVHNALRCASITIFSREIHSESFLQSAISISQIPAMASDLS